MLSVVGSEILRELDAISIFHLRIYLALRTRKLLQQMPDIVCSNGVQLSMFLSRNAAHILRDEMICHLIGEHARELLVQHNKLALKKELAIERKDFESAAWIRDCQQLVVRDIQQLVPHLLQIEPIDLVKVLQKLGFDAEFLKA